jgi:hypothetical protein
MAAMAGFIEFHKKAGTLVFDALSSVPEKLKSL